MHHSQSALLAQLRSEIAARERSPTIYDRTPIWTGLPALDGLLAPEGIARGCLIELLGDQLGSGVETIAVVLMRAVSRAGGLVVVLDREQQFYPPAAAARGLALDRLVVVRAGNEADELWAADRVLRSRAVDAVSFRREQIRPHDYRRLQLAAEEGGTVGVLLRPARARGQPTWAEVQLSVEPRPGPSARRLWVEVTRCRGSSAGKAAEVVLDDASASFPRAAGRETFPVHPPSPLADPAISVRPAGHPRPPAPLASAGHPAW